MLYQHRAGLVFGLWMAACGGKEFQAADLALGGPLPAPDAHQVGYDAGTVDAGPGVDGGGESDALGPDAARTPAAEASTGGEGDANAPDASEGGWDAVAADTSPDTVQPVEAAVDAMAGGGDGDAGSLDPACGAQVFSWETVFVAGDRAWITSGETHLYACQRASCTNVVPGSVAGAWADLGRCAP